MRHRPSSLWILATVLLLSSARVHAYDSATTHPGLTARAALASQLHRVLSSRLGQRLGLFEPLRLSAGPLAGVDLEQLRRQLARLDPGAGYRPDESFSMPALMWLEAGSVLEGLTAARQRHHFLDPRTGRGLDNRSFGRSFGRRVLCALEGDGTFSGIFTGLNFDLSGESSLSWILDSRNDFALGRFLDARERAATAELPKERASALAYALLSAGALLHVLEDAGDPAHVRNDYRVAYGARVGDSIFDRTARYEHNVARWYGLAGIPPLAGPPIVRPRLRDYFVAADGRGLAQYTQKRFFSPGTLPRPVRLTDLHTPRALLAAVNAGLTFPSPRIKELDLAATPHGAYLATPEVPYLVSYRIDSRSTLELWLDDRTDRAYARVLLGQIGRYAAGALDHLFRGRLAFEVEALIQPGLAAPQSLVTVINRGTTLGKGRLTVLVEDARGRRRPIHTEALTAPTPAGAALARIRVPRGAARLAAVFRGTDASGDPLVVVEDTAPPSR